MKVSYEGITGNQSTDKYLENTSEENLWRMRLDMPDIKETFKFVII